MSREEFLARVKQAAEAGRAYRVHARRDLPANAGYVGAGDDPIERMAAEVNAVGGRARIVADLLEARESLREIISRRGIRSALCWEHPLLEELGLADFLRSLEIEHINYASLSSLGADERRHRMFAADVGISSTTYAVAETGTLAVSSSRGAERSASLLPPIHVAIVSAEQMLPDLFDLFAALASQGFDNLPSALTLITGPSKTGDIELKLTTGVHGPGEWHVILVRGEGAEGQSGKGAKG